MKRLHYAWVVSFAGLLIAGAGVGIFNSTLGVFVKPVCEALGFSRGRFTLYGSISMLVCVALMPFYGALFKKYGFKRIALIGSSLCGLVLIGYSLSSELWHFYVLAFVGGLFVNGMGIMAIGILVNKWFIDRKGLATGIALSGSGLLAAVLIPIANRFIELNGWRWTYRFLAFVSLVILIPIILFIVKDKPEDAGLEPYRITKHKEKDAQSGNNQDSGLTRNEAFRTLSFWLLAIAVMGITLCQAGPHIHTISFLSDIGYSAAFASTVASAYMVFLTGFKVVMGIAFDRLGSLKGSMLIGGCCVLFPVFALTAGFPVSPWMYALVLGLASSGATILGPVLTADYFGRKDFSRIFSIVSMFSYIGVAVSSPFFGAIYDVTGSYNLAWILVIGMGIIVCACLFGANRFIGSGNNFTGEEL
jgi:MFS family permease